ncbi:MAG: enoyl-CoA hydratase/isomerase family protein [Pseudomonadota bacterium]
MSEAPQAADASSGPPTEEGTVTLELRGAVGLITLNRPQARNAMTLEMYGQLKDIAAAIPPDGDFKAVIVTGAGEKAFAAGTDISKFRDFTAPQHALDYERFMDEVLNTLEAVPVPTIAAISGACTGGGAAIAACCDLRLATRRMRFGFPIARTLGNCLSMNNLARLSDLMGPARVKEMLFTSRLIEADEALAIGLISELCDDYEALMIEVFRLADVLCQHAPLTLRATKEGLRRLRQTSDGADHDLISMCYGSNDFKEGLEAFLAKRPAKWTGR